MRAVVQRVISASVLSQGELTGSIQHGLLVYLGAAVGDTDADLSYATKKISGLRIFADDLGKMSRSVIDVGGSVLVISQFTLFGDVRKGLRPSFDGAAPAIEAEALYDRFLDELTALGVSTASGKFRTHMEVSSVVDGPVTIIIDSRVSNSSP